MLFTFPSRYSFTIGLLLVFSLAGWSRLIHAGFLVPRATQDTTGTERRFAYATLMLCGPTFQRVPLATHRPWRGPTTPVRPEPHRFGLFPVRSPLLGESLTYFLFLLLLRCFSSQGLPPHQADDGPSARRVVPFGDLRVKGHLHLTAAFRSLSRPSSPVRAKASASRPFLLSLSLARKLNLA